MHVTVMLISSPRVRCLNDDRAVAARIIEEVHAHNRTIDWCLNKYGDQSPLTHELVYGVVRRYFSLAANIDRQLNRSIRKKDRVIYYLLLVGAYQLNYMRTPEHAAIHATVSACSSLKRDWCKGLVNGVLRAVQRSEFPLASTERSFDHPAWLAELLSEQHGNDLLEANNLRSPMCLRVNQVRCDRPTYQDCLDAAGIGHTLGFSPHAILLKEPLPKARLPHWEDGWVAVQDQGAQFASNLLAAQTHPTNATNKLLDACAAPGGKLFYYMELAGDNVEVESLEINAKRAATIAQEGARLGHAVATRIDDACTDAWWDRRPYTHILLDAPCTGTGTIRRHPDIKLLLKPDKIPELADLQLTLLNNLWKMLAYEGTLLYCTCSVLPQENDQVIERFLSSIPKEQGQADLMAIALPTGKPTQFGWQLLPTDPQTDGFYFCGLRKVASQ